MQSVLREAEAYAGRTPWNTMQVLSLYFGGGTPSLIPPGIIEKLITGLRDTFTFLTDSEITVEANPGVIDPSLYDAWHRAGINRISLGVQSLGENTLRRLGRIHDADDARKTYHDLRSAGFDNINTDLMFGVAADNAIAEWETTIHEIADWNPDHVSAYSLIVEEGTPFEKMQNRGIQVRLDEDDEARQMEMLVKSLTPTGLHQYEVSNWARHGCESRHNKAYWDGGSYLSLGPAGHSFDASRRLRFWNLDDTSDWMNKVAELGYASGGEEYLTPFQHFEERVMLTLRMSNGGSETELARLANEAGAVWPPESLNEMVQQGLLIRNESNLRCTERGLLLADEIQARLVAGM